VDRAPLPPHERPWRHPSELGPPSHEPTSTGGRVLIVTTATLSLLLIGLLALSMTPDRGGDPPVAVQATNEDPTAGPAALEQPLPMVTPLGDEGWAVMTSDAVGARAGLMAARLPSGDVVDVEIVRRDAESGVTLVSLPELTHGYQLAERSPGPTDTVVVHSPEPQIVTMLAVARLDVAEGTPVLDDDGALVGICTTGSQGVAVMTVSTMPGATPATSTTAAKPTTVAPTTTAAAPTTLTPTTVAPTTSAAAPTTVATTVPVTASSVPAATTVPAPGAVSGGGASTTAPG
jgi:hypothetical protein